VKLKVDKTLAASIALHVLVIGWGLVSFSTRAFESIPEESVAVDVVSADAFAKGRHENRLKRKIPSRWWTRSPKQNRSKTRSARSPRRRPVVTDTSPPPQPKVEPKPVEKKPDPPKPVAEQAEGRAEAGKEAGAAQDRSDRGRPEEGREEAAAEAGGPRPAKPPEPAKPKTERPFDQSKIAALLDKRDPSRQAVAGDTLNSNAALGLAHGKSADNSATWGSMFKQQVERCWKKPLWRHRVAEA